MSKISEEDVYDEIMAVAAMLQEIRDKRPRYVNFETVRLFEVKDAVSVSNVAMGRLIKLAETVKYGRAK